MGVDASVPLICATRSREQHQPGAGDVLLGPVPIGHDRLQAGAIGGRDEETHGLSHGRTIPPVRARVNPLYASVH